MEIRKRYSVGSHWKCITSLVLPSLKMHRLSWAYTEHDLQNFWVSYPLGQRRVKATSTLLDKGKAKARGEGDHLKVGLNPILRGGSNGTAQGVPIISGNRRMLPTIQPFDRLGKRETIGEIGVMRIAAIPSPKAGVHRELGEIGEPTLSCGPCCHTTGQRAEMRAIEEIDVLRVGAFRF